MSNLTEYEVDNLTRSFKLEPTFNKVIVTLNTEVEDGGLVLSDNTLSEVQYIIAKGEHVKSFELGQKVLLDLDKMMIKEPNPTNQYEMITRIKIDPIIVDGVTFAIIEDRLIKAKYKK